MILITGPTDLNQVLFLDSSPRLTQPAGLVSCLRNNVQLVHHNVVCVNAVLGQLLDQPLCLVQRQELSDADTDERCLILNVETIMVRILNVASRYLSHQLQKTVCYYAVVTLCLGYRHNVVTLPPRCRYATATLSLRYRHAVVTLPPRCRYATATLSLRYRHAVLRLPSQCRYATVTMSLRYRHAVVGLTSHCR